MRGRSKDWHFGGSLYKGMDSMEFPSEENRSSHIAAGTERRLASVKRCVLKPAGIGLQSPGARPKGPGNDVRRVGYRHRDGNQWFV
jgi:hypothetical protein